MRVVVTSVDGSLLDPETQGCGPARQALAALERRSIPLILASQRTRAQLEEIRHQLHLEHPFLSENGMAIYLPEQYFPESILDQTWQHQPPYYVRALGLPYANLRQILQAIRAELQVDLVGFGDWRTEELAVALGITPKAAELAQDREYSEVFSYAGDPERLQVTLQNQEQDLGGFRFELKPFAPAMAWPTSDLSQWFLTAWATGQEVESALSMATRILLSCYQRHLGTVVSLGIGSRPEDRGFLAHVRRRVVLPGPHQDQVWTGEEEGWRRAELPGPEGWNEAVLTWLEETDHGGDE